MVELGLQLDGRSNLNIHFIYLNKWFKHRVFNLPCSSSIPLSNQNFNDFGESVGVVKLKGWRELGWDVAVCWCKILVLAACNLPLLSCRILPAVTPAEQLLLYT